MEVILIQTTTVLGLTGNQFQCFTHAKYSATGLYPQIYYYFKFDHFFSFTQTGSHAVGLKITMQSGIFWKSQSFCLCLLDARTTAGMNCQAWLYHLFLIQLLENKNYIYSLQLRLILYFFIFHECMSSLHRSNANHIYKYKCIHTYIHINNSNFLYMHCQSKHSYFYCNVVLNISKQNQKNYYNFRIKTQQDRTQQHKFISYLLVRSEIGGSFEPICWETRLSTVARSLLI